MEPIKSGSELKRRVRKASVEFLDTGERLELASKEKSYCLFFDKFDVDELTIQFRLDCKDIDSNKNPKLDADFININNPDGHEDLEGELSKAHHTVSESQEERRYTWEFRNFKRSFRVTIDWLITATIQGGSTVTATMIKTNNEKQTDK